MRREADTAIAGEHSTPEGELSVSTPVGFGRQHLQPVAPECLREYPEVNLKLQLVDRDVNLLEEHVGIAWASLGPFKSWLCCEGGVESMFAIRVRLSTTLPESAVDAAVAGLGLVPVTSYQAAAVRAGLLVPVLREFEAVAVTQERSPPSCRGAQQDFGLAPPAAGCRAPG